MAHIGQKFGLGAVGNFSLFQGLTHGIFGLAALGNILVGGDVMGDRTILVLNRANGFVDPEERAILTTILDFAAPILAGLDGFPKIQINLPGRTAGLKNARTRRNRLIRRVDGLLCKHRVDELDFAIHIGDEDGVGVLLDRPR